LTCHLLTAVTAYFLARHSLSAICRFFAVLQSIKPVQAFDYTRASTGGQKSFMH
jgi:hypothetical protein